MVSLRLALAVLVTVIMLTALPADAELLASSRSRVYHRSTCRWVPTIKTAARIAFSRAAEARDAGYRPCAVCRPPEAPPRPDAGAPQKNRPRPTRY